MLELIKLLFTTNTPFYNFDEQCQYQLEREVKTSSVKGYSAF